MRVFSPNPWPDSDMHDVLDTGLGIACRHQGQNVGLGQRTQSRAVAILRSLSIPTLVSPASELKTFTASCCQTWRSVPVLLGRLFFGSLQFIQVFGFKTQSRFHDRVILHSLACIVRVTEPINAWLLRLCTAPAGLVLRHGMKRFP